MSSQHVAVGIDLGGTYIKSGLVSGSGEVLASARCESVFQDGPSGVVATMKKLVDDVLAQADMDGGALCGIGVGSPGPLSPSRGYIYNAANLPGMADVPLLDMLHKVFDVPCVLDNDANVAAYGEFCAGAGSDVDDMVLLTLGTGVGGGVISQGKILRGAFENAAELGHMIVVPDGLLCSCGQNGCLERYSAAASVSRIVCEALKGGAASTLSEPYARGERIDTKRIAEAARAGDKLAADVWQQACKMLAIACINIQHAYNPSVIAFGGGMCKAGDFLLQTVQNQFDQHRWHLHSDFPRLEIARLGNQAGLIGAAMIAINCLKRS